MKTKKSLEVEKQAGKLIKLVLAAMAISLVLFFVFGNNIETLM